MSVQCKARVIADSVSSITGKRMTTLEVEFPRIILAEWNTHNALSKNASSSRAIPVKDMLAQVRNNPAMPVRFGAANKGMQDAGEHNGLVIVNDPVHGPFFTDAITAWKEAGLVVADIAEQFHEAKYAKQICNRLIEPFQMMKVVVSATEWNNFMWLRNHKAADPTIEQLSQVIEEAKANSTPVVLEPGEWHVPYYNDGVWIPSPGLSCINDSGEIVDKFGHTLEHALIISASCCAQVSYRKLDDTIEKARGVVARLNLKGEEPDEPVHASPLEHQATPIAETQEVLCRDYGDGKHYFGDNVNIPGKSNTWEEGITHVDRDGMFGSGNLKGFVQHRQLVPNHVKRG